MRGHINAGFSAFCFLLSFPLSLPLLLPLLAAPKVIPQFAMTQGTAADGSLWASLSMAAVLFFTTCLSLMVPRRIKRARTARAQG